MAGLGLLGETPEGEMLREDDPVGFLNDEPG
jgi:hypothetical protein